VPSTGRRLGWWALGLTAALVALYVALPQIAGLDETWGRLRDGDPWWLAAAAGFEVCSYAGYVIAFRGILTRDQPRIGWRETYDITMAGVAATRLLATAGAGGIALSAWALVRSGMARRVVASRLTTFYVVLYGIYMFALVVVGVGLRSGLLGGRAPFALTVVPAIFGGAAIVIALTLVLVPADTGDDDRPSNDSRRDRWRRRARAAAAAVGSGMRGALALLARRDPALAGAVAWWAFDVAVLWACLHAFGEPPPLAVVVMAYFTGMLANTLPLPGGIGGVEGGMIGALIAFGVADGLAIVAVLSYRAFAFWLPTIPGVVSYVRLRREVADWSGERPAVGS
jgi:uncharacterized membrane protein YbhN (UPF0104 family)